MDVKDDSSNGLSVKKSHPHFKQSSCQKMSRAFKRNLSVIRFPHPAHSFPVPAVGKLNVGVVAVGEVVTVDCGIKSVLSPILQLLDYYNGRLIH
jgi:hypothetical protein